VRRRLLGSYLALTAVVLAALEIPLAVTYASREEASLETELVRDAFFIGGFVEDTLEGTQTVGLQGVADRYEDRTGARVVIVDADGRALADSEPLTGETAPRSFAARPEIALALDREVATGTRSSSTLGTGLLYVAVPVASGDRVLGAVRLTYSTDELDERVRAYWLTLAGIAVLSLAAATGVGLVLARWVTHPLDDLRVAAAALGAGDRRARAPERSGPPEVRELAAVFNATAQRLDALVTAQDEFVADASHQLRTPLTALRLRLEMLEAELPDGAASDDVDAATAEVRRLSRLVDGLLALARAERTDRSSTAVPIDLDAALAERALGWRPVADERGVTLGVDGGHLRVRVTPDRLSQVLDNLLANALEVSPPGTTIELTAEAAGTAEDPRVELHVVDQGPGLTDEQRTRAFDRFWRSSTSRGELGGTGLGLSIVQRLVRADGGDVELLAGPGGGLDAVVRLPVP
jgi:signal transduction histidine kinase